MKSSFPVLLFLLTCTPLSAQRILVDHNAVALFEHIPPQYVDAAKELRMLFMDRSVGGNINDALSCLSYPHVAAPNSCKRYQHRDSAYAVSPSEVYWEGSWDRSRWRYEFWPSGCSEDADCFVDFIEPRIDSFDVVGFQFSYLAVMPGSNIIHPVDGFFGSRLDRGTATSYSAFADRHPGKTILWWTTSLARGIGSEESQVFNAAMREYARVHDLVLFDVADILSHDPAGNPCFDNRDGVEYLDENHPDDGLDIPAICPQYTTETEGGHLGSISAGGIRVAKAFWVLMARIAGWDGAVNAVRDPAASAFPTRFDVQLSPNPVSESLTVSFFLAHGTFVTMELFDLLGRRVAELYAGQRPAGAQQLFFRRPPSLAPGRIYFLRVHSAVASGVARIVTDRDPQ